MKQNSMWKRGYLRYAASAMLCGAMLCSGALAVQTEDTGTEDISVMETIPATDESGVIIDTNPSTPQQAELAWFANGDYQIVSAADNTVLSTNGRGGGEKAAIVCRADQSLTLQTYGVKQAADGTLMLTSRTAKDKMLSNTETGLVQTKQGTAASSTFVAVPEEDGTVTIRLAADLTQALTNQDGAAVMAAYTGEEAQKWTLRQDEQLHEKTVESGVYTIDNVKRGKSMMISGASNTTGQPIVMASKSISKAQRFYVNYVGDGKYTITAFGGDGKAVTVGGGFGAQLKLGSRVRYYIDKKWDGTYSVIRAGNSYAALSAGSSQVKTTSYSGSLAETWTFDSKVTEDTAAASKQLKSVMKKHPSGKYLGSGYSFAGGYQCMGFGREVFYRTFGKEARWNYDGSAKSSSYAKHYTVKARSSSYSSQSMKKLMAKAKPGDVLQMNAPKIHTMIFVSSDSTGFTVYDANWVGSNKVSVRHVDYGAWSSRNSRGISLLHSTNYPAK